MRARPALLVLGLIVASAGLPGARADGPELEASDAIPYEVQSGDVASRVARRVGLPLRRLRELNPDRDLDRLRPGEVLVVGHGHLLRHVVRGGDTLGRIAHRYGVSLEELRRWNGLRSSRLLTGSELQVYARRDDPPSASIGSVHDGRLEHGVQVRRHPGYAIGRPERAWVTREVADHLEAGFDYVRTIRPRAPRIEIRDASIRTGGPLREHHSHQSGRDVDMTYYRRRCPGALCGHFWMSPSIIDADLQWALLSSWIRTGSVEMIFIDHGLQAPLYEAARRAGATRAQLSSWFQWPRGDDVRYGIIRHVPAHREHLHVRFVCAPRDTQCLPSDGRDERS